MTNPEQHLTPADFSPQPTNQRVTERAATRPRWVMFGLVILTLLALGVFFVLPKLITSPTPSTLAGTQPSLTAVAPEPDPASDLQSETAISSGQMQTERSPFAEAQSQKQRRTAQEALQKVLELQEILTDISVSQWATDAYEAAIETAKSGDAAYRERRFSAATTAYLDAAEQLLAIENSIPERTTRTTNALLDALATGDEARAKTAFSLLEQLAANDPQIDRLQGRLAAINDVNTALTSAAKAAENSYYEQALTHAEQALSADPDSERAAQARTQYQTALQEQRYRQAMSHGFLALEQGEFDAADNAFKRAASLQADSAEAQAALAELASARTAAQLRSLRQLGTERELAEDWQEAEERYQEALAIDSSLVFAQQGLARVQPRKALDEQISKILDAPERLVDDRALSSAQLVLQKAQAINNPGPVLSTQINAVKAALQFAATPLNISLVSDGLTDVTLLRVKRLGSFSETQLALRPGRYTALGIRNGYRDVRIDFDVEPDNQTPVDVRCTESIEGSL